MDWLGSVVGCLLGAVIAGFVRHEFRRRPGLARRRHNHRNLLTSGLFLFLFAALAWFLALAAGTSGYATDRDDAVVFTGVGLALGVAGAGLLALWWRRAGQRP